MVSSPERCKGIAVFRDATTLGTPENLYKRRELKSAGGLDTLQHTHLRKTPAFKPLRSPVTKHKPESKSQQLPLRGLRLLQMQMTLKTQIFPQAFNQTQTLSFLQVSAPLLSVGKLSATL